MKRTFVNKLSSQVGSEVLIKGFVQTIRNQSSIKFLIVRDVTGTAQCVVLKDSGDVFAQAGELTAESVVSVTGLVKAEKQAPSGFEIQVSGIEVLSAAQSPLPIPVLSEKGADEVDVTLRLDHRWLDLRKPEKQLIFKVWTELEKGFRSFYDQNGFTQLYSPSFLEAPSEGGTEVFEVQYFDRKAYLSQSPQFYKQMAMASGFEKVFLMVPAYRAEPSFTTRHMTEFTTWDFEVSYIESFDEILELVEDQIIAGFTQVKATLLPDLVIPTKPFPRYPLLTVKERMKAIGITSDKPLDISAEEEREMAKLVKEETGTDFFFVTDWPQESRPFYHKRHGDQKQFSTSADLIYRGLELITCAQREHRYEVLEEQVVARGIDPTTLKDYLSFFKYGCPPHGGGAFGAGRIVMKILDLPSVKEATYLPRDVKRINP